MFDILVVLATLSVQPMVDPIVYNSNLRVATLWCRPILCHAGEVLVVDTPEEKVANKGASVPSVGNGQGVCMDEAS